MIRQVVVSLGGLLPFLAYFGLALIALVVFEYVYTAMTPYDEWRLIREHKNVAAAVALGGALLGFSLPLASAAAHSASFVDFLVWAIVALGAQLIAYGLLRLLFLRDLSARIEAGETASGILLAALSLAIGVINAACMTY